MSRERGTADLADDDRAIPCRCWLKGRVPVGLREPVAGFRLWLRLLPRPISWLSQIAVAAQPPIVFSGILPGTVLQVEYQ